MKIARLDHLVLTVASLEATCDFYVRVLGMEVVTFKQGRKALTFGSQKINLHQAGAEFQPHAENPTTGSADICLIAEVPLDDVVDHFGVHQVVIEEGPVERTGATGLIRSVYIRDPDGNLLEISEYVKTSGA
jgi:catechol 2,3-dioxygenase-like lactoylglutathione lyase family enzyme